VDGEVLIGPNAVLALAREGYTWGKISVPDLAEVARTPAFWRFARRPLGTGVREMSGSLSKRRFVAGARAYVPELTDDDVRAGYHGGPRPRPLDADGGSWWMTSGSAYRDRVVLIRNAPNFQRRRRRPLRSPCAEHIVTDNRKWKGDSVGTSASCPKAFGVC
jgi:L-2-hydroxyglutarate oxidase LhgO